jgi:hypothetical protein
VRGGGRGEGAHGERGQGRGAQEEGGRVEGEGQVGRHAGRVVTRELQEVHRRDRVRQVLEERDTCEFSEFYFEIGVCQVWIVCIIGR